VSFGFFLRKYGQRERGRKLIEEALAICERLSDISGVGDCHQFLAWLDRDAGNATGAIAHFREALRCFEQVQSPDAEEVRADLRRLGVADG
jgi:hypothetical protein